MFAFEPCVTWYLWFNHRGRESTSYSYLKSSTSPINISTINWIRIADVSAAISLLSRPLIQNDMPTPQANCTSNHQPIMTIDSCSHQQDRQLDFFSPNKSRTRVETPHRTSPPQSANTNFTHALYLHTALENDVHRLQDVVIVLTGHLRVSELLLQSIYSKRARRWDNDNVVYVRQILPQFCP